MVTRSRHASCLPAQAWAWGLNLCAIAGVGSAEDHSKSEMPAALTAAAASLPALGSRIRASPAAGMQGAFLVFQLSKQFNNSACATRATSRTGCPANSSPGALPPR